MLEAIKSANQYFESSHSWAQFLHASDVNSVHLTPNTQVGLSELMLSLAIQFSHKRSAVVITGGSPFINGSLTWIQKMGLNLVVVERSKIKTSDDLAQIMPSDCLFVFLAEDDYLTGEVIDWIKFESVVAEKKSYFLHLSHFNHFTQHHTELPLGIRLCHLEGTSSWYQFGSRYKVSPMLSGSLSYDLKVLAEQFNFQKMKHQSAGAFQLKVPGVRQIASGDDRALLELENVHAGLFVDELCILDPSYKAFTKALVYCKSELSPQDFSWSDLRDKIDTLVVIWSPALNSDLIGKVEKALESTRNKSHI
jgi:hypothetical protein